MKATEYLIIGAGIVGCSAAYFLAKENKRVTIVDRTYPCNEASGVNAGGLELLQQPPKSLPLHVLSAKLWNQFQNEDGIDVGYHRTGGLFCILKEQDLHMLDEQAERFAKNGLPVERLNKEQIKEKVPYICDNVIAANFSPTSGYSNPLKAGVAILMAAKKLGVEFYDHQLIQKIEPAADGEGYVAYSDDEEYHAKKILIASGIRSPRLLEPLGVHIELEEKHNMITVTEKAPHFIDYTITTPTLTMKQTAEGSILIGGGREGYGDLATSERKDVSIEGLCFNVREAQDIIPSVKKLNILRSWSGFEGFTPERLPYIGEAENYPGVYYAVTGFCGYCIGPAVAAHAIKCMNGEAYFKVSEA
ncbi:MAG TPA: FAD-binding oxidoreductase [Candidatus Butyricicoccus stercorigallinarum]|nr:FAD-binding oxidoreductase [Candidatus Butyricicoccus stercorigallinarum]